MASRTDRKAAARATRQAQQHELELAAARRRRLRLLGAILCAAIAALVVAITVSSGGAGTSTGLHLGSGARAAAVAAVSDELTGIPQSRNVLGDPSAPVTITEYGDLVCPVCKEFAITSEPQIIATLVRTGKAKLVYRGFETASVDANGGQYLNTQVAARSAGLQNREWNYLLILYREQPTAINGTDAELVPYVNTAYLQRVAAQVRGLNLARWQSHMADPALKSAVAADTQAGNSLNVGNAGTPDVFVTGPAGTIAAGAGVPTLAQIQELVTQAG